MELPNYYDILGIPPDADMARIELAFRQKADAYNPAIHPEHDAHFQLILDAYSALKNPESRAIHDQRLKQAGLYRARRPRQTEPLTKAASTPTLTELMNFDWEALDEAEKKRQAADFRQEVSFKLLVILAFIGLISLIWFLIK